MQQTHPSQYLEYLRKQDLNQTINPSNKISFHSSANQSLVDYSDSSSEEELLKKEENIEWKKHFKVEQETKQLSKYLILGMRSKTKEIFDNVLSPENNGAFAKKIQNLRDKILKSSENAMSSNNSSTNSNTNTNNNPHTTQAMSLLLSEDEIIIRFRELSLPIRYFGETNDERLIRLRHAEICQHERVEGASKGLQNEFSHSIANEVEKELEAAMAITNVLSSSKDSASAVDDGSNENNDSGGNLDNSSANPLIKHNLRRSKYDRIRYRKEFEHSEDYVYFFFKRMLREWEILLLGRKEEKKQSAFGKTETARQKQARRDIRSFFKQLKNRTIPADVLQKSEAIVNSCLGRNYTQARKFFFEMAIGNDPWPMGVTMVGIHERSGRSKIFSSQIAHVMNNETQRKYIHAMGRLITFCEKKYPRD